MSAPGLPPTISGLRRALAEGSLGVDEALHAQRAHLEAEGARYRCVAHVFDAAGRRPDGTRPLAGVGLAHKDVFDTADRLPVCGRQHAPPGRPPKGAAAVLRSLEGAGGAHLAALAMVEDACGATGEARPEAQPVNPLDPALAVGGSSSGSAVAVAAGLCYASLGTDTAGSVRIPAASCGVLGLKTTHGAISTRGVRPLAPSLDTVGILARSAADAAAALAPLGGDRHRGLRRAAARWDGIESYLLQQPERRLAVARASELAPDVAAALDAFAASVAPDLREVSPSVIDEATSCAEVLLDVEAAHGHWRRLREDPRELSAPLRAVVGPGAAIPALWYREALARRAPYLDRVRAEWFGAGDLVLLPALPNPIPEWRLVHSRSPSFDARQVLALSRWMAFVNYLGLPSVVFPVGRDARGHPVSVQVVGRPHSECALLAFAYRVERERRGTEGFTQARAGPGGPTRRAGEA